MAIIGILLLAVCLFQSFFIIGPDRLRTRPVEKTFYATVETWVKYGYLNQFGLWGADSFSKMKEEGQTPRTYRSAPPGYILPLYFFQKLSMAFRGRTTNRIYVLYIEAFPFLTAFLIIGLFLNEFKKQITTRVLVVLSCIFGTNYVSHYTNTYAFSHPGDFDIVYLGVLTIFVAIFFSFDRSQKPVPKSFLFLGSFIMAYISPFDCLLALSSFLILTIGIRGANKTFRWDWVGVIFGGILLATGIFTIQIFLAKMQYPNLEIAGSSLKARTGFDGSTVFYRDFYSIIWPTHYATMRVNSVWKEEFLYCLFAFLFLLPRLGETIKNGKLNLIYCSGILILVYVFQVAFFCESVVIHPYFYELYIMTPFYILGFLILPVQLCLQFSKWKGTEPTVLILLMIFGILMLGDNFRKLAISFPRIQ